MGLLRTTIQLLDKQVFRSHTFPPDRGKLKIILHILTFLFGKVFTSIYWIFILLYTFMNIILPHEFAVIVSRENTQ